MSSKFTCDTGKRLLERCNQDDNGKYESKEECQKDCFTDNEKRVFTKFTNEASLYSLVHNIKKVSPIKDIPLMTYKGKYYNEPIFKYDETRFLYRNINHHYNENEYYKILLKNKNVMAGKHIYINKSGIEDMSDFDLSLLTDIKSMIDKNIKFCYKHIIYTDETDDEKELSTSNWAHAIGFLIKLDKNVEKYDITYFIYEPNASTYLKETIKIFEEYIINLTNLFGKKQLPINNIKFINLSNFYGIQQNEIFDLYTTINVTRYINFLKINLKNIIKIIGKILKKFILDDFKNPEIKQKINLDNTKDISDYTNINKIYDYLNNNYFKFKKNYTFIEIITNEISYIFTYQYNKEIPNDFDRDIEESIDENLERFTNLYFYLDDNLKEIHYLLTDINTHFLFATNNTIDVFNNFCYAWSKYVILLIINNDNVNPYDIIKQAYFQTNNEDEIKYIFNKYNKQLTNTFENKFNVYEEDYEINEMSLHQDLKKLVKKFEIVYIKNKLKEEIDKIKSDKSYSIYTYEFKYTKQLIKLYYKITNFIILLLLPDIYNSLKKNRRDIIKNPIKLEKNTKGIRIDDYEEDKESIDFDEIMNKLSQFGVIIDGKNYLIKDLINNDNMDILTNYIMNSKFTFEEINNLILSKQTAGGIDYKDKYLKYKQKYLQLKNKL